MRKIFASLGTITVSIALVGSTTGFMSASASQQANPSWAGYAVSGGTYTEVGANWRVPTAKGSGNRQVATWVGLGGVNSSYFVQTGTSSDTVKGKAVYRAWYETPPSPPVFVGRIKPVHAGDLMEGIVSSRGDTYTLDLYDWGSSGRQLRWSQEWQITDSGLDNSSAEAIVEDPALPPNGHYLATLTKFGKVTFTNVFFNTYPATDFNPTAYTMTGNRVRVSGLNTTTDGFSVTYKHS